MARVQNEDLPLLRDLETMLSTDTASTTTTVTTVDSNTVNLSEWDVTVTPAHAPGAATSSRNTASMLDPLVTQIYRQVVDLKELKKALEEADRNIGIDVKCRVCQGQAGKHSYYGGRVCPSCRAFFRRAVQSRYYEIFGCKKLQKCKFSVKTRKNCQFCRFKLCLESGMRISWVLPESERSRRFGRLQKNSDPTLGPVVGVTFEENLILEDVKNFVSRLNFRGFQDYAAAFPELISQVILTGFSEVFLSALDEFKQLSTYDQRSLLKANVPLIAQFKLAITFVDKHSCLTDGVEKMLQSKDFPALDDLRHQLCSQNLDKRRPVFNYWQFFSSPWASNFEEEMEHFRLIDFMRRLPRDDLDSPMDQILANLLRLLLAFNADSVTLQNKTFVEQTQEKYAWMLQRYLSMKYGEEGRKRFGNAVMIIHAARRAHQILGHRLLI